MEVKVIFEGDDDSLGSPVIYHDEMWGIPKGWYILDKNLIDRPNFFMLNGERVNIIDNCQIKNYSYFDDWDVSVIKTDKELKLNDILIIEE